MLCIICCIASAMIGATLAVFVMAALAFGRATEQFYAAVADREHEEFYTAVTRGHHLEPKS